MRIRKGHKLYGASLDFGHAAAARHSFPEFERARAAAGRPDLTFQQGVPGDFDLATFTLGPVGAIRSRRPFTEATLAEIRDVTTITGPDTLFQIEVPVELVLLTKAPPQARPVMARLLAKSITGLAAATPVGTRFGVHLCLGDMNNRPFGTMTDVSPLVLLASAILRGWPDDRPLDILHAPFAAADQPATTDPAFYAPLARPRRPCGRTLRGRLRPRVPVTARPAEDSLAHRRPSRPRGGHRGRVWFGETLGARRKSRSRAHRRPLLRLIRSAGPEPLADAPAGAVLRSR